jgi:hypothetical protein
LISTFKNQKSKTKKLRIRSAFFAVKLKWRRLLLNGGLSIIVFIALMLSPSLCSAQAEINYDEVMITVSETQLGAVEIPAVIYNEQAYLPVKEFFDFLEIKNDPIQQDSAAIGGFFINPNAPFQIDKGKNQIVYNNVVITLNQDDLIFSNNNLYLKAEYFGKIFGVQCDFSFRSLTMNVSTKIELPAARRKRQEEMRGNISKLKSDRKADTIIPRQFSIFRVGMADWQITTLQQSNNQSSIRADLDLGGIIAGGEANIYLHYNSNTPFSLSNQFYNWRYVNNDNKILRQASLGRVFTASTSSLIAPLNGIQFSNTPTYYKKSFATYTISNTTEPNWIVELYVNNVLINYTKADAAGYFSFDVPIMYGTSMIKFRYYGPWGEERSSEQNVTIPFTFLPENQFEYSVTAGIISDEDHSKFSRANMNYGLSKRITIGSGIEYLSSVQGGKPMPFVNASFRLGADVIFSAEHTSGVVSKANINYHLANNIQFDFNYAKYDRNQTAVRLSYLEERKAVISMPIRSKRFNGFTRLTIDDVILPKSKFTSAEFLLGVVFAGISSNFTTYAVFTDVQPVIFSKLSLTYRLPKGIRLTPQAQYEYNKKYFSMFRTELEKQVSRNGFMNISYERNMISKINTFLFGFRYNFSFAQIAFSARQSNQLTVLSQSAGGGGVYDDRSHYFSPNIQKNVGRAGLMIIPFLDYNGNGQRDKDEPQVAGLIVRLPSGRIDGNQKDSVIRVSGLEPYTKYTIDLDGNSFENPAWKIHNKVINVTADPNTFKLIEVPVSVEGEVSGTVYLKKGNIKTGLGRIIVNIYNIHNQLVAKTLTEPDGYFNYLGLSPGDYTVSVDENQLLKTNMTIENPNVPFSIRVKKEGDIFDSVGIILVGASAGHN